LVPSTDDEADDGDDGSEADDNEDDYDREDSFLADSPGASRPARRGPAPSSSRRGRRPARPRAPPRPALPPPQPAIQPGSTRLGENGRRYLAYTRLWFIALKAEPEHNVVEVAFHNTAANPRRVPLLDDFFGFTLGALGEQVW
jgi:hypothetical protein